jgi:hypothetical protein
LVLEDQSHVGKYLLVSTSRTVVPPGRVLTELEARKCCTPHVGTVAADATVGAKATPPAKREPRSEATVKRRLAPLLTIFQ